ncbi:hypothetical protein [Microvirga puerhi]|uniref:Uncharacterized protein n=1 Tax=Microvirga puerhi TaxID=2876078 RepID=A0ABS7VTM4_9HYPH|nr:hypothetical protein [Microvirga puerhi]MBZ6078905.1 hypothetical protein [Microvirga puerhi]
MTVDPRVIQDLKRELPPVFRGTATLLHRLVDIAERAQAARRSVSVEADGRRYVGRFELDDVEADGFATVEWSDDLARFQISLFDIGLLYEARGIEDPSDVNNVAVARNEFSSELRSFRDSIGV